MSGDLDVAFVSNVAYPFVKGGAERRFYEIGRRLADRGHDVTLYTRRYWEGGDEYEQEGMTLRAVAPQRELYAGERRSIGEAVEFSLRLARPLLTSEHDVIDVSAFPYFPVFPAAAAAVRSGAALVTTWHEVWNRYWLEYLGALGVGGIVVERLAARLSRRAVAVSRLTADRLGAIGVPGERITTVYNGIETDRIAAVEPDPDAPDVLFVGRLVESKRVDQLLSAFDRVAADRDIRLGIVGDGPESDRLRAQASALDSRDRITFYGSIDDDTDVYSLMRGATAFVSPSTREGFGMALLEAMAADCQIVAVRHPDSAVEEVLDDAGLLVDSTVEGIADGLTAVFDGERPATAPQTAAQRFDWECIVDDVERIYRDAVDTRE
ncbi:glycosyltransferase family 4 protein [Halapricum hydrolyticum]|uniref:Glycosyltransferase family 4 protein n=1 Tax=Halapricum hydrolyticum TaxID=2979991 RepID=A0AAE3I9D2_9EURY|nr:glycosyltransferase family 4 protein [Halapricum hydrolyticum]MCU4718216.1 glycosyltransferase family 4 protein [Halapricum hydrolyticum]MCU4726343.1 glycosyltransferase family 4 protein [Halapricum hydrolyticum]